jgi:hypothetical protein
MASASTTWALQGAVGVLILRWQCGRRSWRRNRRSRISTRGKPLSWLRWGARRGGPGRRCTYAACSVPVIAGACSRWLPASGYRATTSFSTSSPARPGTTPRRRRKPWPHDPNRMAYGKPGAVQETMDRGMASVPRYRIIFLILRPVRSYCWC